MRKWLHGEIFKCSQKVYKMVSNCSGKSLTREFYWTLLSDLRDVFFNSLHKKTKKWSFPLGIFSVNVTNSAVTCEFGHNFWRNP